MFYPDYWLLHRPLTGKINSFEISYTMQCNRIFFLKIIDSLVQWMPWYRFKFAGEK